MFESNKSRRIKELASTLAIEGEKYVNAVRSREDYNTLRTCRENIGLLKKELELLYNSSDDITTP